MLRAVSKDVLLKLYANTTLGSHEAFPQNIPGNSMFITFFLCATRRNPGPESGVLYISGGGFFDAAEFVSLVRKVTGKDQPNICVITTPQGKRRKADYEKGIPFRLVASLKNRFGLKQVTELYTLSSEDAKQEAFYKLIDDADSIHISGGNQSFMTDVFLRTETLTAMQRLLERGGVISGSSAGA